MQTVLKSIILLSPAFLLVTTNAQTTIKPENNISNIEIDSQTPTLTLAINGYFNTGNHYNLFIDADNDKNTGYSKGIIQGADYMIEDHYLYRYPSDADGWKWKKMDDGVKVKNTQESATFSVSTDAFSFTKKACVGALVREKDYSHAVYYPQMVDFLTYRENSIFDLKADGETPTLTLTMNGFFHPKSHYNLFIDADNDKNTGYSKGIIQGADYMIEDHYLYRYPSDADGWKWKKMDDGVKVKNTQESATFSLPKDLFSFGYTARIGAIVKRRDYSHAIYYPQMIDFSTYHKDIISNIEVDSDTPKLSFTMSGYFNDNIHYNIFIDADNNKTTGYSIGSIQGADYMIEGHHLYSYPTDAHGWKWTKMDQDVKVKTTQESATFSIPKDTLTLAYSASIGALVQRKDYSHAVYYPQMVDFKTNVKVAVSFKESDEIFKNPERGLYALRYMADVPYRNLPTDASPLNWIKSGPYTTFRLDLVLAGSRNTSISQSYIEKVRQQFDFIRQAGLKTILRVTYNESNTDELGDDADIDTVLSHIRQLKPIIEKNKDIIMSIGAGYIGAWGEWHTSTNNLTTPENMQRVEEALMQNTPKDIKIMFRRPSFLMNWFPDPLSEQEANNQSDKSRAGFHDDCFAWDFTDMGTFSNDQSEKDDQFRYLKQTTKYLPVVGEMCTSDVANEQNSVSCESGIDMAEKFHYSLLGDQIRGDWTKQEKLPVEVYKEQGCWDDFQRRLGYRFVLKDATIPKVLKGGDDFNMSLVVVNRGFSATVNERPVYLVLNSGEDEYKFKIDTDPRKWYSGEEVKIDIDQTLPDEMNAGNYDIYLWMPDRSPNLQNNSQYSIRVANEGVWDEERGYNKVGTLQIIE